MEAHAAAELEHAAHASRERNLNTSSEAATERAAGEAGASARAGAEAELTRWGQACGASEWVAGSREAVSREAVSREADAARAAAESEPVAAAAAGSQVEPCWVRDGEGYVECRGVK